MSRYSRSPAASRAGTFISRPESTNGLIQRSQLAPSDAAAATVTSATFASAGQGGRRAPRPGSAAGPGDPGAPGSGAGAGASGTSGGRTKGGGLGIEDRKGLGASRAERI